MKNNLKKVEEEEKLPVRERIENFLHSDSLPATATKTILAILALGGIVFGAAVVPGVVKLLKEFDFEENNDPKKFSNKQINNAISTLKRQKYIKISRKKNNTYKIKLTNRGIKRVLKLTLDGVKINKPKQWDGKWRIVIFDIPVEFNDAREALRKKMKELGFRQFQKSVWINPYECEDGILFIAEVFRVEKYVEIITAEKVLHEKVLEKSFSVKF